MRTVPVGVALALASALLFGISGPLAKSLYAAGWTPAGAILFRVTLVAALLAAPTLVLMRGRWRHLVRHWKAVLVYGVMSICGVQLFSFASIEHISIAVEMLIEYTAPVLVVFFLWVSARRRPGRLTLAGVALAMGGLVLVLDLGGGLSLDPAGVAFAVGAAVCLASYFIVGSMTTIRVHELALIGVGMWVALPTVGLVVLLGLMPAVVVLGPAPMGDSLVPWWVPALLMIGTTILGYITGMAAMRRLGATMSSFLGLSEVVFAAVLSWLILGEVPTAAQAAGGVAILLGVITIKVDEARREQTPEPVG